MVPTGGSDCAALSRLAPGPATGLGDLGLWHDPGGQWLPKCGQRGAGAAGWARRRAPTAAGVAVRRQRQGSSLRHAGRPERLLRSLAALDCLVVAGERPGAGLRRHRPRRSGGGPGDQRALPRQRHSGRLACAARQCAGGLAAPLPATLAAPGASGPGGHAGHRHGRPGTVEPGPVGRDPGLGLASPAAHSSELPLPADRAASPATAAFGVGAPS
jgi:hypothetical protein